MKTNKYFRDLENPSMNELIYWFLTEFNDLAEAMKNSYHEVKTDEPNPYHIEGDVFCHTMMVCQRAEIFEVQKVNKICALLHDIGKPTAREVIPFEAKKPVHSESNELRNNGKNDGKTSGMNRVMPKSGLKCHFRGHEGLSFYLAIEPLNRLKDLGVLTQKEVEQCLTVISMHGTLFDNINDAGEMIKPYKVFDKFENSEDGLFLFNALVTQVKCDSLGRFYVSKDGRKSNAYKLGTEIFTEEQFLNYYATKASSANDNNTDKNSPWLEVLVGVPGSGKSTYLNNKVIPCEKCNGNGFNMVPFGPVGDEEVVHCEKCKGSGMYQNYVVISRDNTLMEYAKENGIIGRTIKCNNCNLDGDVVDYALEGVRKEDINLGKCQAKGCKDGYKIVENYSQVWKELTDEDQKEIDKILEDSFKKAFNNKENMVIDMTNMSNKGQRKWVNKCGNKYRAKAVVFATSYDEVQRRLEKREKETGKSIPAGVVLTMMKGFGMPIRTNFAEVEFIH